MYILSREERVAVAKAKKSRLVPEKKNEGILEAFGSYMKLRFRERARADIRDIYSHIFQWSKEGAVNVSRDIYAACRLIAEHPFSAPETNDPFVRVKHLVRFPYCIFYSVHRDMVEILHIRHTSRRERL